MRVEAGGRGVVTLSPCYVQHPPQSLNTSKGMGMSPHPRLTLSPANWGIIPVVDTGTRLGSGAPGIL